MRLGAFFEAQDCSGTGISTVGDSAQRCRACSNGAMQAHASAAGIPRPECAAFQPEDWRCCRLGSRSGARKHIDCMQFRGTRRRLGSAFTSTSLGMDPLRCYACRNPIVSCTWSGIRHQRWRGGRSHGPAFGRGACAAGSRICAPRGGSDVAGGRGLLSGASGTWRLAGLGGVAAVDCARARMLASSSVPARST